VLIETANESRARNLMDLAQQPAVIRAGKRRRSFGLSSLPSSPPWPQTDATNFLLTFCIWTLFWIDSGRFQI
jgi:hypothetical protein